MKFFGENKSGVFRPGESKLLLILSLLGISSWQVALASCVSRRIQAEMWWRRRHVECWGSMRRCHGPSRSLFAMKLLMLVVCKRLEVSESTEVDGWRSFSCLWSGGERVVEEHTMRIFRWPGFPHTYCVDALLIFHSYSLIVLCDRSRPLTKIHNST